MEGSSTGSYLSSTGSYLSSTASGGDDSSDSIWYVYFLGLNVWIWGALGLGLLLAIWRLLYVMKSRDVGFVESLQSAFCCCCGSSNPEEIGYTQGVVKF